MNLKDISESNEGYLYFSAAKQISIDGWRNLEKKIVEGKAYISSVIFYTST